MNAGYELSPLISEYNLDRLFVFEIIARFKEYVHKDRKGSILSKLHLEEKAAEESHDVPFVC